jgi:hypothetical protein
MLRYVAFIRTDVSEECIASIIRVIRIGVLGKVLAPPSLSRLFRNVGTSTAHNPMGHHSKSVRKPLEG